MCLSTHHRNIRKLPLFCPYLYHCSMWEWRLPSKISNKNPIKPRLVTIFVNRTWKNLVPRNFFLVCEIRLERWNTYEIVKTWSGEKLFTCNMCGHVLLKTKNLRSHEETKRRETFRLRRTSKSISGMGEHKIHIKRMQREIFHLWCTFKSITIISELERLWRQSASRNFSPAACAENECWTRSTWNVMKVE